MPIERTAGEAGGSRGLRRARVRAPRACAVWKFAMRAVLVSVCTHACV